MSATPGYEKPCPSCKRPVGDHTVREYGDCLKGSDEHNWHHPFEDTPRVDVGVTADGGQLVGALHVSAGLIESAIGTFPALRFVFEHPGEDPMEKVRMPAVTLVMDEEGLERVARLVRNAVKKASREARRAA